MDQTVSAYIPQTEPAPCSFCATIEAGGEGGHLNDAGDVLIIRPRSDGGVTDGHMLFVPIEHAGDAGEDPDNAAAAFAEAARYLATLDSGNIITSKGAASTQTVYHTHIHVVPRRPGDGLPILWEPVPDVAEDEATVFGLRARIAGMTRTAEAREQKIATLTAELATRDARVLGLKDQLARAEQLAAQRGATIGALGAEVASHEETIGARDAEIGDLSTAVGQQRSELIALRRTVAELGHILTDPKSQLVGETSTDLLGLARRMAHRSLDAGARAWGQSVSDGPVVLDDDSETARTYPQSSRFERYAGDEHTLSEFLIWCAAEGFTLTSATKGRPVEQDLVYRWIGVDQALLDQERRAMFAKLGTGRS